MLKRLLGAFSALTMVVVLSLSSTGWAATSSKGHGPDVNGPAKFGLCNAYFHGSPTGLLHKHHSRAFRALEAAAAAKNETVAQFCAGVTPISANLPSSHGVTNPGGGHGSNGLDNSQNRRDRHGS
jgi:hypothetical protein